MMVPCFLYFIQILLLLAVSSLDPPVYYVVSPLKILATAVFSIIILRKDHVCAQMDRTGHSSFRHSSVSGTP
jgi:hypothetical protein